MAILDQNNSYIEVYHLMLRIFKQYLRDAIMTHFVFLLYFVCLLKKKNQAAKAELLNWKVPTFSTKTPTQLLDSFPPQAIERTFPPYERAVIRLQLKESVDLKFINPKSSMKSFKVRWNSNSG